MTKTPEIEKISVIPSDDPAPALPAIVTPMAMLDRAVASGASIEILERLMGLQERWEANQARKAFEHALADAKSELPIIKKNRRVDFENRDKTRTTYMHEDLAGVVETVVPILSKFGLNHRYRLRGKPGEPITVTCIISHRDGHSEENEISAGADTSGGKNPIQSIKSAITYMERITLLASLGLAAGHDDDGKSSSGAAPADPTPPPGSITQAQADQIVDLLESKGASRSAFLQWVNTQLAKAPYIEHIHADHFEACLAAISRFKPKAS